MSDESVYYPSVSEREDERGCAISCNADVSLRRNYGFSRQEQTLGLRSGADFAREAEAAASRATRRATFLLLLGVALCAAIYSWVKP